MAFIPAEIIYRLSQTRTRTGTNGGLMSASVLQAAQGSMEADFTDDERTTGITVWHKLFVHAAKNANATPFLNPYVALQLPSPGNTRVLMAAGTARDTQSGLAPTRYYGAGLMAVAATAGATTIYVDTEGGSPDGIFQPGDSLYLSDGVNSEKATLTGAAITWVGQRATLNLTAGLIHDYAANTADATDLSETVQGLPTTSGRKPVTVSSRLSGGGASLAPSVSNWVETSAAGTYNEASYPLTLNNLATIEQDWTLTFTGPTTISLSGHSLGTLYTGGSINNTQAPTNPDYAIPYFSLNPAGFGGTWQAGDTITWTTRAAALPFWIKIIVPPNMAAFGQMDGLLLRAWGE
ncbi:MAG: hypothetical protein EPN21_13200 [Methylococcaceae bacterium]|nr:MAG: hypothetical protein EPN21_13200 [Methylococcaceae bacterium]